MVVRSWAEYEKGLLLGGRWLPVTKCVLFLNAPVQHCVELLLHGRRGQMVLRDTGYPLRSRTVHGDGLEQLLSSLLPLDAIPARKYLLLPTVDPGWTAFFDSWWRGLDPISPLAWFAMDKVLAVSFEDVPNTYDVRTNRGFWGGRRIQAAVPKAERYHGDAVALLVTDGGRWVFHPGTEDFPMGVVWDEGAKRVPDRFTHEHMVEAARRLGVRPYDEDFYAPQGWGVIVERTDPRSPQNLPRTLAQARGEEPV